MRIVDQDIIDRNADVSAEFYVRAEIEPSSVFFDDINEADTRSGADIPGWLETAPVIQQIAKSPISGSMVTFYRDTDFVIRYQIEGSSDLFAIDLPDVFGVIGVSGSSLFCVTDPVTLTRYTIDWDLIEANSDYPFTEAVVVDADSAYCVACHALSWSDVVGIWWDEGGFKARLYHDNGSTWDRYDQPYRFPFHFAQKFTEEDVEVLALITRIYTTSVQNVDGDIFTYVSNFATGAIDGIRWDHDTKTWGDVFTAVPTSIDTSMCALRINNSYAMGDSLYICANFRRIDEDPASKIYTLLLRSKAGYQYALDRFSAISNSGHRWLAFPDGEELVVMCSGAIGRETATYTHLGDDGGYRSYQNSSDWIFQRQLFSNRRTQTCGWK
jgi:hypothetical protein